MTGEAGFPAEGPLIDVRSPAERWSDAGRARYEQFRARVEGGRFDLAALWWMILVVAYAILEIYSALRASGFGGPYATDWWTKAQLLTNSGGMGLVLGAMIGVVLVALAVFVDGRGANLALRLAMAAGVWAMVTALVGVAVAFHVNQGPVAGFLPPGTEAKVVSSLGSLCTGGLGLVVATAAWCLAPVRRQNSRVPRRDHPGPDIAELS
jgi:amino acid transporter